MNPLDANYYQSSTLTSKWISFSASGEHQGNHYYYFMREIDLACFDSCGRSYNNPNTFCLNLDLYSDNSIYEIYINGVPQSPALGIIPLPNPFNPPGHTPHTKTQVQLCSNWKAGKNTLVIRVASSATVAGILAEGSTVAPPPPDSDTINATICQGQAFRFGDRNLTEPGYYFKSFHLPNGCDSNVMLHLNVKPTTKDTIRQRICEGEEFLGYTAAGIYTNVFTGSNGCDSVRVLELTVQLQPRPDLKPTAVLCNDSLVLKPGEFDSYLWHDGSTGNQYVAHTTGFYSVTVTNSCGTAQSGVQVINGNCGVYFPNAFTPNGDGRNETFKVITDNRLQAFHLEIFNRWGQVIFETADPHKGWDGTFNGRTAPNGTYVWKCWYKKSEQTTNLQGTLILTR